MRHLLALVALLGLVLASSGCRHVAGACDCDCEHGCGKNRLAALGTHHEDSVVQAVPSAKPEGK